MSLLLGVNAFAGSGDGARRQSEALESWRGLTGVKLANLGWPDEVMEVDGFATHPLLRQDSRTVTGRQGPRKPVVREVFDHLAAIAAAEGCRWFGYANSDIAWTQAAIDAVAADGRQVYAFSRGDVDPATGSVLGMVTAGVDAWVVDVAWWGAHRRRFRPYIGGEPIWDNVYTSILLSHGDGLLLNREPLVRHEQHPAGAWRRSPFAPYLGYLAALDSLYFSRWAHYHQKLTDLRARRAAADEEQALQRESFGGGFSTSSRIVQVARALKARARWAADRRRSG
jgi:hypothetical protein